MTNYIDGKSRESALKVFNNVHLWNFLLKCSKGYYSF